MPFGYIPHKSIWKDIILKVFGWPNVVRRLQAPIIMRMLAPSKNDIILDAGCGGGNFAFEIAKNCKSCVGIDINIDEKNFSVTKDCNNLSFLKSNLERLPLQNDQFDKVLLSSVLQMVQDDKVLLKQCYRVTKRGGILVLSVPVRYIWFKSLNNIKNQLQKQFGVKGKGTYELDEVIELLKSHGYNVVETEYSPKKWGAWFYELWLFTCHNLGLPLSNPFYFLFLYPFACLDKVIGTRRQKGNEVIIKAIKIQ